MENVLPLLAVGFLYVLTNPAAWLAVNLFRLAAIGRIVHTLGLAIFANQAIRGLGFGVPFFITAYMSVQIILSSC